jgi:uncharacterized protein (DUF433 family)
MKWRNFVAKLNLVSDLDQAIENIRRFWEQSSQPALRDVIAYVRDWYAIEFPDTGWMFAPSKFIGYAGMDHKKYAPNLGLDGRKTERCLSEWFAELDPRGQLAQDLMKLLKQMAASHGKVLNSLARIHVLKGVGGARRTKTEGVTTQGSESWRITSDPEVLSGKPCIRGMRIRVADILEMLSLGATRLEMLEDYPYLEDGDITAALEYAMRAVDHRLIKAA